MGAVINAIGAYGPGKPVTNAYFEKYLDTSDQWIKERTGIETRFFTSPEEYTSHMCIRAARDLMERFRKDLGDVDMAIVATITPDYVTPNTASRVLDGLGIKNAGAMDISTACSGFCYALIVAKGLIAAGTHKKILVFGADNMSRLLDFSDRGSCILFGDGAGVVLVERTEEENCLLNCITGTDADKGAEIYITGRRTDMEGADLIPDGKFHQNGTAVYKWALGTMTREFRHVLEVNGLDFSDIDFFLPHSANCRMLEAAFKSMDVSMDRCAVSVRKYANTSSASIPLAWYEAVVSGKIKKGDMLALLGFGAGLTYAGLCVKNAISLE